VEILDKPTFPKGCACQAWPLTHRKKKNPIAIQDETKTVALTSIGVVSGFIADNPDLIAK
jgi:hypothetical protein